MHHAYSHVGKDSRLNEEARVSVAVAASLEAGSLSLAGLDVAQHLVELQLVHDRALRALGVCS